MRIALLHNAKLPVSGYGGTERAIWWLAKGLSEQGVSVTLVAASGSQCPFADVFCPDFSKPLEPQVAGVDLLHYFSTPDDFPQKPYLVTIEGNGKAGEVFLPQTVFVSRNHAERHGAEAFVYNGLDPDDYLFSAQKDPSLLFLAKAAWKVKNVSGAIRIARAARRPLHILGGRRWPRHWRGTHWEGMLGGRAKLEWIARSAALLFPVRWHEPFGIAITECLVSGTPVLGSPYGSLPELVGPEVGVLAASEEALAEAVERLPEFKPQTCRDWAMAHFHYRQMAAKYVGYYERVLAGNAINAAVPRTLGEVGALLPLPRRK